MYLFGEVFIFAQKIFVMASEYILFYVMRNTMMRLFWEEYTCRDIFMDGI